MAVDPEFRLVAYHEARECMKMVSRCDIREPEFWANLLGAVVNTNIACVPDSVVSALVAESAKEEAKKAEMREYVTKQRKRAKEK